jgi:hypothetical protein
LLLYRWMAGKRYDKRQALGVEAPQACSKKRR